MNLERFFNGISYTVVFCGFLSLWVSGTFGVVSTLLFLSVFVLAGLTEGSKWQVSERAGTVLIVLALPAFYLGWRSGIFMFSGAEAAIAGILARMILSLTAIKLLQKKSGRDWIFLYLMAFFQVLLAAGLSISAVYLASFILFLLVTVCAIIAFEIRKTSNAVLGRGDGDTDRSRPGAIAVKRLPAAAFTIIVLTFVLALPLFFVLPRVGSAGLGGGQSNLATSSGFSDIVKLGGSARFSRTMQ
jgi:hypothetical protein